MGEGEEKKDEGKKRCKDYDGNSLTQHTAIHTSLSLSLSPPPPPLREGVLYVG